MSRKPRAAVFSPVNPVASGISDYCEEFLRLLQTHMDFSLYLDAYQPESEFVKANLQFFNAEEFPRHQQQNPYDHVFYHIGNSPYHNYIYPYLYQYPGIMVLHDAWLLGTRLHKAVENWEGDEFRAELKAAYGEKGDTIAEIILSGLHNQTFLRHFPMHELQVRASLLTVVHDSWLAEDIMVKNPGSTVMRVPHRGPQLPLDSDAGARVRQSLNLSPDTFLLGSFGFVGPEKRIDPLLKAFSWMHQRQPDSRCLIVGKAGDNIDLDEIIHRYELQGKVIITGRLPEKEYFEHICACDIISALRWPTHRESSAAINSALYYGKAVVSTDLAHLRDYPEDTLVRISPADEEKQLRGKLLELAMSPPLVQRIGAAGRKHLERQHSAAAVAHAWLAVIERSAILQKEGKIPDKSPLPQHLKVEMPFG